MKAPYRKKLYTNCFQNFYSINIFKRYSFSAFKLNHALFLRGDEQEKERETVKEQTPKLTAADDSNQGMFVIGK